MEDAPYARALLAILTNPTPQGIDPADPYGQADDGIDRYDGFGRDVRVTSLEVVDGDHGDELEAQFELVEAPAPIPTLAAVRVPFDRRWRELSGFQEPAAYAPEIARQVVGTARRLVDRHGREDEIAAYRARTRAGLPPRGVQWEILLDALSGEGRVEEVAPGRIEVRPEGEPAITVILTPDQWEEIMVDHGDDPRLYVGEWLGPRDDDERFWVFYGGGLHRSTREELPPVRGTAMARRLVRFRAEHPEGGSWHAYRPEA